jgi:Flp pilus assembly protein TadD
MEERNELNKQVGAAWSAFREGQNANAIKGFEQVLAQDRDHVDALFGLGLVLRASGDINGARTHWERALEIAHRDLEALGDVRTIQHERLFMSTTMLKQRLAEISHA